MRAPASFVVLVKPPDDHPAAARLYGPLSQAKAEQLAAKVVEVVEADITDDSPAWAWVLPLRPGEGRVREARRYALRGE